MREPRIVVADDGAFKKLTEEGWTLRAVHGGKMYFDREVKKTRSQKKAETTPELAEFKKAYPRKEGTSSDAFAAKYSKASSEYGHAEILASLSLWKEYWRKSNVASGMPEKDTQFVPYASTWINQKRYSETPSSVFVTEKRTNEMVLEELLLAVPEAHRSKVRKKAETYLSEHTEKKPDAGLISRIFASITNA